MNQISFPKSLTATKPAPPPDKDAINHLLLFEFITPQSNKNVDDRNFYQNSKQIQKSRYTNVKLGNSRSTFKGLESQKSKQYTSKNNQKITNSCQKKYLIQLPSHQIEVNVVYQSNEGSKQKLPNLFEQRQRINFNSERQTNQNNNQKSLKFKAKKQTFNQSAQTLRNAAFKNGQNEQYLHQFIRSEQKSPNRSSIGYKIMSQQQMVTNQIKKAKIEIVELELQNTNLKKQLHICQEEIALKQSENIFLIAKNSQLIKIYDFLKQFEVMRQNWQQEGGQLRNKNNMLYCQIEKHMDMLLLQKCKNEQIMLLVQNLNANIVERSEVFNNQLRKNDLIYKNILLENYEMKQKERNCNIQTDLLKKSIKLIEDEMTETKHQNDQLQKQLNLKKQQINKLLSNLQFKDNELQIMNLKYKQQKSQLIQSNQNNLKQLNKTIRQERQQIEKVTLNNMVLQTRIQSLSDQKNQNIIQMSHLNKQIEQIFVQKEQLSNERKQLSSKLQDNFLQLKQSNLKIIEFTNNIINYQDRISQLQRNIWSKTEQIKNKDQNNELLTADIQNLSKINKQLKAELISKDTAISNLNQKNIKYEKLRNIYKDQLNRVNQNKQVQWEEMKNVYQNQISIMQARILSLSQNQSPKKSTIKQRYKVINTKTYNFNSSDEVITKSYNNQQQQTL